MADASRLPQLVFWILTVVVIASGELHRTRRSGAKSTRGTVVASDPNFDTSSDTVEIMSDESSKEYLWLYSLVSATFVGLSGIFPLIVIPIETGAALKHGASGSRLKLLLSFAVGSLLGDVFLHLLPEAWMHVRKGQEHQEGVTMGLWVMAGVLTFLIIEKIFSENYEEFEEKKVEKAPLYSVQKVEEIAPGDSDLHNVIRTEVHTDNTRSTVKKDTLKQRHSKSNTSKSKRTKLLNGGACNQKNGDAIKNIKSKESEKETVHIRGYLNLMANVIDNFTHGLAVGGSYIVSTKVGLLTTFAILVHEIPHEVGDFAILLRSGFDRWKAAKAQLFTASGSLLGAIVALSAESAEAAGDSTAWILPFTSGGFIYIALVTVTPDLLKEHNSWESFKQVLGVCLGVGTMAFVTLLCG